MTTSEEVAFFFRFLCDRTAILYFWVARTVKLTCKSIQHTFTGHFSVTLAPACWFDGFRGRQGFQAASSQSTDPVLLLLISGGPTLPSSIVFG